MRSVFSLKFPFDFTILISCRFFTFGNHYTTLCRMRTSGGSGWAATRLATACAYAAENGLTSVELRMVR